MTHVLLLLAALSTMDEPEIRPWIEVFHEDGYQIVDDDIVDYATRFQLNWDVEGPCNHYVADPPLVRAGIEAIPWEQAAELHPDSEGWYETPGCYSVIGVDFYARCLHEGCPHGAETASVTFECDYLRVTPAMQRLKAARFQELLEARRGK